MSNPISNYFETSKIVIAKVFRDLRLNDDDWTEDAIIWIVEGMEMIGVRLFLIPKSMILKVKNHTTVFPKDIVSQLSVLTRKDADEETPLKDYNSVVRPLNDDINKLKNSYFTKVKIDINNNEFGNYFTITKNSINTSFEEGFIAIYYKGLPIDYEGYPYIPNESHVKEALYYRIVFKLIEGGYQHPAGLDWQLAKNEWEVWTKRARSHLIMPSMQELNDLVGNWNSLIPFYKSVYNSDILNSSYNFNSNDNSIVLVEDV